MAIQKHKNTKTQTNKQKIYKILYRVLYINTVYSRMKLEKSCVENYTFFNDDSTKFMRGGFSLSSVIAPGESFDRYNHLSVPIPLVLGTLTDYEDKDYDEIEVEVEDDIPVIDDAMYDTFLSCMIPIKNQKNQTYKKTKLSSRKTKKNV